MHWSWHHTVHQDLPQILHTALCRGEGIQLHIAGWRHIDGTGSQQVCHMYDYFHEQTVLVETQVAQISSRLKTASQRKKYATVK